MADKKISQLTAATTPLAGSEVLPIVQGGATVKVSVDNLTTGKVVPANGIQFPGTQVASAGANTLDDYEEGTFTPYFICDGGNPTVTYSTQSGYYTKIGNMVFIGISLVINTTSGGSGQLRIGGLPFTAKSGPPGALSRQFVYNFVNALQVFGVPSGLDSVLIYRSDSANTLATSADLQASAYCFISGCYLTA